MTERSGAADERPSWRLALAPGEHHDFSHQPGWWDAREFQAVARAGDDMPRLRASLILAFPPLPDGSRVLDIAAGTGTLATLLARYYPDVRFTLLDANPAALRHAERKLRAAHPDVDFSLLTESIDPFASDPLPGGPFRLATSSIALHDIAPPAGPDDAAGQARHHQAHVSLLGRVHAALEPGGHFIYADAMRPRFRVAEHLAALHEAGFTEVDCAYVVGRLLVCGGQRPVTDHPPSDV